jgi:hypothetical protein
MRKKLLIIILALCMAGCHIMQREPTATASPEAPVIVVDNAEVLAAVESLKTNAKPPKTNDKYRWVPYACVTVAVVATALLAYFGYDQWCQHQKYRIKYEEANKTRNRYGFEGGEKYKMGMQILDLQNELKIVTNQYKSLNLQLNAIRDGDEDGRYKIIQDLQIAQREIQMLQYNLRTMEETCNEQKNMLNLAHQYCDGADQTKILNAQLIKDNNKLKQDYNYLQQRYDHDTNINSEHEEQVYV